MPREGAVGRAGSLPTAAGDRCPAALCSDPISTRLAFLLHGVYDLAWYAAGLLASPWLLWRSLRERAFGSMVLQRLGRMEPLARGERPRILVHMVSVGEVRGARSVVAALGEYRPELEIVLSVTTDTGLDVARKEYPGLRAVRYPVDVAGVVDRFLRRVRPDLVVLFELELWPNFLRACNRFGAPVCVVNGRITQRSHDRYQRFGRLFPQLDRVSLYCVQSEEYADRFRSLGVAPERILVTGNVKLDTLPRGLVDPGRELSALVRPRDDRPTFVAGSTHAPEERWIVEAWKGCATASRLVLVPRHPPRCGDLANELAALGVGTQRLSALRGGAVPDPELPLIVDTVGELEYLYGLADLAFVGGSLIPRGGQNLLEPAAQGRPVLVGPHLDNFRREARLLARAGASRTVADVGALATALDELLSNPERRQQMGAAGRVAVAGEQGATRRTLAALGAHHLDRLAKKGAPSALAGAQDGGMIRPS